MHVTRPDLNNVYVTPCQTPTPNGQFHPRPPPTPVPPAIPDSAASVRPTNNRRSAPSHSVPPDSSSHSSPLASRTQTTAPDSPPPVAMTAILAPLLFLLLIQPILARLLVDTAVCPCTLHLSIPFPSHLPPRISLHIASPHAASSLLTANNFSASPSTTTPIYQATIHVPRPGPHTLSLRLPRAVTSPTFRLLPRSPCPAPPRDRLSDSYLYIATLTSPSTPHRYACTATLLSHTWLLTAAHCAPTTRWHVQFHDPQASVRQIARVISHPRFDLALIQLVHRAPSNVFITVNDDPLIPRVHTSSRLAAYTGITLGSSATPLRQLNVPVVHQRECLSKHAPIDPADDFHSAFHICTANSLQRFCDIDANVQHPGAPLVQFDTDGRPFQIGIASIPVGATSQMTSPRYVRTSAFVHWMRENGAEFSVTSHRNAPVLRQTIERCPTRLPHEEPIERQLGTHPSANVSLTTRQVTPRIVGGDTSSVRTRRYMVSLVSKPSANSVTACTGSLLSKRWVLTAGHCAVQRDWDVRIGKPALFGSDSVMAIEDVFIHELLTPENRQYDIALVKLASDAPPNSRFVLVNGNANHPKDESFVRAIGYGTTAFGEFSSNILRQVDLPVVNAELCSQRYQSLNSLMQIDGNYQMCAGYLERGGCDSCQGDSGGPVIQFNPQGKPVQVAIISFAHRCAEPGFPGVNTRVSAHINWMRSKGAEFIVSRNARQVFVNEPEKSPIAGASPFPSVSPLVDIAASTPTVTASATPAPQPPRPPAAPSGRPSKSPRPRPSSTPSNPNLQSPSEQKPTPTAEVDAVTVTPDADAMAEPESNSDAEPVVESVDDSSGGAAADNNQVDSDDGGVNVTPIIIAVGVAGGAFVVVAVLFAVSQSRNRAIVGAAAAGGEESTSAAV